MDAVTPDGVLAQAKEQWDCGDRPDAARFMSTHPFISDKKSIILELAYEEFFRRTAGGERIDAEEFCNRFPICRLSLRRRIEVHEFLHESIDDWSDAQWPNEGDSFGDFSLVRELGRGVDSRVFLAKQRSLSNRLVVLKLARDCYREARLLSTLEHPHIVPILSIEEDEATGLVAICMPYLTPWTLMDLLDVVHLHGRPPKRFCDVVAKLNSDSSVEPPTLEEAPICEFLAKCTFSEGVFYIMAQVARALQHTHERGILHLDLKPSNILLTRSAIPLVVDFNLSANVDLRTAYGGTLPYMPPEQLQLCFPAGGEEDCIAETSDVFSLGAVTFQLLSGELPFPMKERQSSVDETARELLAAQSDDIKRLDGRIFDRRTSRFLKRCLSLDQSKRPNSMRECEAFFRHSLALIPRIQRWGGNHRLLVTTMLLFGVMIIAGFAYLLATRDPADVRYYQRGRDYLQRGENQLAIASITKAIELDPSDDIYWYSRGRARQAAGDVTGALDDYDEAIDRHSRPEYYAQIGHCYTVQKKYTRAVVFLNKAVDLGVDTPNVYNCLGRCLLHKHEYEAAEAAFNCALAKDSQSWQAYYGRAEAQLQKAKVQRLEVPSDAKLDIQQALELGPRRWNIPFKAAAIHYEASRGGKDDLTPTIEFLQVCTEQGIPRHTFESFARLPGLSEDRRCISLLSGYRPQFEHRAQLDLLPEPIPFSWPEVK